MTDIKRSGGSVICTWHVLRIKLAGSAPDQLRAARSALSIDKLPLAAVKCKTATLSMQSVSCCEVRTRSGCVDASSGGRRVATEAAARKSGVCVNQSAE